MDEQQSIPPATPESPRPMPDTAPPPAPPPPVAGWAAPAAPAPVPGAAGFVFADVPNRVIALVIDAFVVFLLYIVLAIVLGIVGLSTGSYFGSVAFNPVASLVFGLLLLAVYAGYFIWSWTSMRATPGMRFLGMQVGNAFDGKTLTMDQALRRGVALWGPWFVSSVFGGVAVLGNLLGLLSFFWAIYLLYTTATSPTKQGFHDKFANSVVVKAGRVV